MKALITGSGGLIGSECVRTLHSEGWDVVGVDNDMRAWFFGDTGSTRGVVRSLIEDCQRYRHVAADIRDRAAVRDLIRSERPAFIVHSAAQPSHDKAASVPYEDFDVNAGGTMNLLVAARDFVRDSPFCFTSTNKVYGDRPNYVPMMELETRFDYAPGQPSAIDETMPVDQCLHSVFGASKLAADVMCQEFGRYFNMPVGIFRGGCLTGPQHASVELHGYLNYIVRCAVLGKPYTIFGYKGKQVRDQIHTQDVNRLFLAFYRNPRCGEVYNLGGGRSNSISILETVRELENRGHRLTCSYKEQNRVGDHICYISDLTKVNTHFPEWRLEHDLPRILDEIVARYEGEAERLMGREATRVGGA